MTLVKLGPQFSVADDQKFIILVLGNNFCGDSYEVLKVFLRFERPYRCYYGFPGLYAQNLFLLGYEN